MSVVADASTLIGLSRIGQLSLLSGLYGQVIMPRAVYDEVAGEPKPGSRQVKEAGYLKVENIQDEVAVDLLLGSFWEWKNGRMEGWKNGRVGARAKGK